MPDTPHHRASMYQLVQDRRRAGLPPWDRTLHLSDVFHNDGLAFEEKRDQIVARIRTSGWLDDASEDLTDLVDELAETEGTDTFDPVWNMIYDYADADRVWIETH